MSAQPDGLNRVIMPTADYRIVPYRPEYKAQVIEFQKDLWSPNAELNEAYLDWKHLRNPYVSEPLIYLALCGNNVVGMRGFFAARWQFGSSRETLVIPCAADMLIAPDHRNRSLMTLIMKAALKDLAQKGHTYAFSMSAGSMTLVSQMAMGWRSIGSLQPKQRIVPARQSFPGVRTLLRKSPRVVSVYRWLRRPGQTAASDAARQSPANHFDVFDSRSDQRSHRVGTHVSIQKAPRPADMAELVARLEDDGRIRHVEDEPYFAWRFQNPRSRYRFLFWDDGRLEGYLVLQATPLPWMPHINLVAWEATTERACADLLQTAIELVGRETLFTWSATLGESEQLILDAAGFTRVVQTITQHPATVLVRSIRDEMLDQKWLVGGRRLLDLGSWDLRMIYSDGF
jgi:GNAT superfamily N-acetyltransferase